MGHEYKIRRFAVRRDSRAVHARAISICIVAAAALPSAWADASLPSCGPEMHWEDFSSIAIAVKTNREGDPGDFSVEQTVFDDGSRIVGTLDRKRAEVIELSRANRSVTLGSEPRSPIEFAEIGMIYEIPLQALKQRFHAMCDLREQTEYPVDIRLDGYALAGELDRTGDSIHFVLAQDIRGEKASLAGHVSYRLPRGTIPADIPIEGWTIFGNDSVMPEGGKPSTFKTLRELQDSLASAKPAK